MNSNYPYLQNNNPYAYHPNSITPYTQPSFYNYHNSVQQQTSYREERQQPIRGQATWTEGGQVTKCGIPWSENEYMTVAVGQNSGYRCGQTLRITNLSTPESREVLVTVVDQVTDYPPNRINLHRRAFEALGANPQQGVINVEIAPHPALEQENWGNYLVEVAQASYPGYQVTNYSLIRRMRVSATQTKETYEFDLQSPQGKMRVRGNVVYNPRTNQVISLDFVKV